MKVTCIPEMGDAYNPSFVDRNVAIVIRHRLRIRRKRIRSLGSTSTTGGSCD